MREVRPFFTIMILLCIYVLSHYTVGKSIIKSFYDIGAIPKLRNPKPYGPKP